jgi:hypothetical protein
MKLCVECQHVDISAGAARYYKCNAPQNMADRSPVTGEGKVKFHYCDTLRTGLFSSWLGCRFYGICGKEGRWYEEITHP